MNNRTYTELQNFTSFIDRYNYLKLQSFVGEETFGFDRYLNQRFYRSREWLSARNSVLVRDNGYDMGLEDYKIPGRLYVHHMNPITKSDLAKLDFSKIVDPEYLITVSHETHNAIHYGDLSKLPNLLEPRQEGDTKLW